MTAAFSPAPEQFGVGFFLSGAPCSNSHCKTRLNGCTLRPVTARKTVTGFDSPSEAVMNRTCTSESGFFTSVPYCIRMPQVHADSFGGPDGEAARLAGCFSRSVNPVSGYLPFDSGRFANQTATEGQTAMAQLATIQFHDQTIIAIEHEGAHYVAMKPIVENIGLNWDAQRQRIKRHPVLSGGAVVITVPSSSGDQETTFLPVDMLNGWLFGVDVNRVRPELRERLMQYQRECFQVLNAHFNRQPLPNLYKQQPGDKLMEYQQLALRAVLEGNVKAVPKEKQGDFMMKGWSKLKSHFGVPYRQIPAERFDEALSLLMRHVTEFTTPAIEAPSVKNRRWLISFDHTGREVAQPIEWDDCLLKYQDLPKLLAANDNMVASTLLADIANACLQRLARRSPGAALAA